VFEDVLRAGIEIRTRASILYNGVLIAVSDFLHYETKPVASTTIMRFFWCLGYLQNTREELCFDWNYRTQRLPHLRDGLRFTQLATPDVHHFSQCTYSQLNRVRGSFSSPGWPMERHAMGMTDAGN
jgi:hypothetical protein